MRWLKSGAYGGALLAGALAGAYFAGPALGSGPVAQIEVAARPVPLNRTDPAATRAGRLLFLGGLDISSPDQRFGGLSALLWEPECGRLLAVTDTGNWIILDPREEDGRLTGLQRAWLAPLRNASGAAPSSKRDADAESLARTADGRLFVGYEGDHRIETYAAVSACRPESLAAAAERRLDLPEMTGWPANGGAEAMADRGARLLIVSEAVPGAVGGRAGLLADPGGAPAGRLSYAAPPGHEPTALDPLDGMSGDGRMLVLHRRFTPLGGVSIVLGEAEFPATVPASVVPREIVRLAPPYSVDNMEGLAVRAAGDRRFVYLVSDNNFNPLQRTLLLKFELLPATAAATGPETKKGG
jgi:hypothetical protein